MLVLIEGGGNAKAVAVNLERVTFMEDLGGGATALHFAGEEQIEVAIPIREIVEVFNDLKQ